MPEFLELLPPPEALTLLLSHLHPPYEGQAISLPSEWLPTHRALGRVTSQAVTAPSPLPAFPRSTVDGYAVRAADTHGASETLPAYLSLVGEVPMGASAGFVLDRSQCALIHTGGMLPQGADAVVMLEHTQPARPGEVEVLKALAGSENVLTVGEDVAEGAVVIPAGALLRPAEIGGLMALGLTQVAVVTRPRVGILSSGDEVISPEGEPGPGQVRDVNAYTLSALVEQSGGDPLRYGIIPDSEEALFSRAQQALKECDLVVITAGSSASTRDLTAAVINRLGQPGVLVHGVNVRPGKPTILGICHVGKAGTLPKAVIGLPGNPVSALVIAGLFVTPVIECLLGLKAERPRPAVPARLALNLASQAGREDWIAVQLVEGPQGMRAEPVFGKSNLIFSLARADGLLRIPPDATGLAAGEAVMVYLM